MDDVVAGEQVMTSRGKSPHRVARDRLRSLTGLVVNTSKPFLRLRTLQVGGANVLTAARLFRCYAGRVYSGKHNNNIPSLLPLYCVLLGSFCHHPHHHHFRHIVHIVWRLFSVLSVLSFLYCSVLFYATSQGE